MTFAAKAFKACVETVVVEVYKRSTMQLEVHHGRLEIEVTLCWLVHV